MAYYASSTHRIPQLAVEGKSETLTEYLGPVTLPQREGNHCLILGIA